MKRKVNSLVFLIMLILLLLIPVNCDDNGDSNDEFLKITSFSIIQGSQDGKTCRVEVELSYKNNLNVEAEVRCMIYYGNIIGLGDYFYANAGTGTHEIKKSYTFKQSGTYTIEFSATATFTKAHSVYQSGTYTVP